MLGPVPTMERLPLRRLHGAQRNLPHPQRSLWPQVQAPSFIIVIKLKS